MSISTKRELLLRFRREYQTANRPRKGKLLDSLIESTGYNRKYAISILSQSSSETNVQQRTRKSKYGSEVTDAVRQLWKASNGICAKRLRPFLPTLIDALERHGHMKLDKLVRKKVLEMSLSTLERMLKKERDKDAKGKSLTRPGSLLKKQVSVKTFAAWNDQQMGFFEVDLVAHCGGNISGRFIHTRTMTDIATGWTELASLPSRADAYVRIGIEEIIKLLPFKLKGIDCDNGTEFLNHKMVAWCEARKITFTRSRAYRKNDQAHVEEKNGSVVRKLIGYERFEGSESQQAMSNLYSVSRLYMNYFQPCMKLVKNIRVGAKVSKQYDTAKTPLERLLTFKSISKQQKASLLAEFRKLDPVALLSEMTEIQAKLWRSAVKTSLPSVNASSEEGKGQAENVLQLNDNCPQGADEPLRQHPISKRAACRVSRQTTRSDETPYPKNTRINFTETFVDNAAHPPSGQIIYRDSKLIGFGLRATARSKSFVLETRVNGKNRRITIGRTHLYSVNEAREEALRLLRQIARGLQPLTLKKRKNGRS